MKYCANLSLMSKKATITKNNEEKIYEIGYHLISSIAEENVPAEVEKIKDVLAKEKALIILEEAPKLRPLAYSIKKAFGGSYKTFDKAYFGFIKFEISEGGDIQKVDASLKSNESILRYLVVSTVRENTMYSPKITVFSDKESKVKITATKVEKIEKPASIEEIDKSIDELVEEEA
jgi:ribosomal protein S6